MNNTLPPTADRLAEYVDHHRAQDTEWMGQIRAKALDKFQSYSWPTQTEEEWRRTDVSNYDLESYRWPESPTTTVEPPAALPEPGGVWPLSALIYKGDGTVHTHSPAPTPQERQKIEEWLCAMLTRRVQEADNRFQLWNLALLQDGWIIWVPPAATIAQPLVFTSTPPRSPQKVMATPHIFVMAQEETQLCCIHRLVGEPEGESLYLPDCTLQIGAASRLHYVNHVTINIDSLLFGNGWATVARDGYLRHAQTLFGGMCAKVRLDAQLSGEGSAANLDGIYFGHEDQHFDLRTVQRHQAPHTQSFALYRGAATDQSHTIYQGMIQVAHEALGTDAYLTNNNLLLSDEARSDSIPSLNISTDEVKCSHGSTTGAIDEIQRYYLQCRGFSQEEAMSYIVVGFFEEVIDHMPAILQEEMIALVQQRISSLGELE